MNLIPFVTQTAMGIRGQLKIFGNDYNTPDHTCIRDYIYVVDLAKAHVKAMERVLDKPETDAVEVFNIGTGRGLSTLEVVEGFEKATGVKVNWTYAPRREGDIEQVWGDVTKANEVLEDKGYLWVHSRTARLKREVIRKRHPGVYGKFLYGCHYLWHRVCPKLKLTKWFYYWVTKGQNRTYHRVELLGRMYRAGFAVIDQRFHKGEYYILGQKFRAPIWDDEPTCGPVVKLKRVGFHGEMIGVYKFRTMYSYSEYLQPDMLEYEGLQDGGKFAHDYRVNGWGKILRKTWLDELPMFINVLKGQMKLVGVRPLSKHYFSLYTPEMQALHVSVKPGLLPPFYYDEQSPVTLDDVQASERRYIEAYHQHPFATDWRYFWGTVGNILFKHKRSQ